jgi:hypothetical protein
LRSEAKGVPLDIIKPKPGLVRKRSDLLGKGEQLHADLLGRAVSVVRTPVGLRAMDKGEPSNPAQIEKYLAGKFGARLEGARAEIAELPTAHDPNSLFRRGFRLLEQFWPGLPPSESDRFR